MSPPSKPTRATREEKLEAALKPYLRHARHRMAMLRELRTYVAERDALQRHLRRTRDDYRRGPGKEERADRLTMAGRLWLLLDSKLTAFERRWAVRIEPEIHDEQLAILDGDDFFLRPGWLVWTAEGVDSVIAHIVRDPLRFALVERQAGVNEIVKWIPLIVDEPQRLSRKVARSVTKGPFEMDPKGRYTVDRDYQREDPVIVRHWGNGDRVSTARLVAEMYPELAKQLGYDPQRDRLPRQTPERAKQFNFDRWNRTKAERKTWSDVRASIKKRWKKLKPVLGPFEPPPQRRRKRADKDR